MIIKVGDNNRMVNKRLLMSEMVLNGYNQRSLAEEIGMSKNTMNLKINGKSHLIRKKLA